MKKLVVRFLALSSLCLCLGLLSSSSLAGTDNERVQGCRNQLCIGGGSVSCWAEPAPRNQGCFITCAYDPNCGW